MSDKNTQDQPTDYDAKAVESNALLADWRLIQLGEVIPTDSEFIDDDCESWIALGDDRLGSSLIGRVYTRLLKPMRTHVPALDPLKELLS